VHQGHRGLVVVDGVLDGLANQALRAFTGHRLDTDTRGFGETDLVDAQLVLQEVDQFLGIGAFGFELDTGIDVFRVFAEDDHIDFFRLFDGRRHTLEVLNGAQANVQVKLLAQCNVQGTNATAHGRGQWTLDGDHVVLDGFQRFSGHPHIRAVHFGGFFTGVNFHPVDFTFAVVCLGYGGINAFKHDGRDIGACAIAFDIGDDGLVWYVERKIGINRNFLARSGDLDVLIRHGCSSLLRKEVKSVDWEKLTLSGKRSVLYK